MGMMDGKRTMWLPIIALMIVVRVAAGAEWMPATVRLSDGTTVTGSVYIPDDRIQIYDETVKRRYTVRPAELKRIETIIEKQGLEEKWLFRESGLDDKVRTGRYYPVREYRTRATFHDGRQVNGHVIAKTVYVKTGEKKLRYILRHKHEGEVGEHLSDLLYVRSIDFLPEGAGARGTIEGTLALPTGEVIRRIIAVNRDKLFSAEATFNAASGRFRVANCTEGTYDLSVVTNRAVYTYFSREKDEGAARLDTDEVAQIQAWVDKLRDFFHSQTIVYAAGNPERAFALVWEERRGGTTLPGLELLHRYDIWAMHRPKEQWQIEKRFFLWRAVSRDLTLEKLDIVVSPELGGHTISADVQTVELETTLQRNKEPLVPPPSQQEPREPDPVAETVAMPAEQPED